MRQLGDSCEISLEFIRILMISHSYLPAISQLSLVQWVGANQELIAIATRANSALLGKRIYSSFFFELKSELISRLWREISSEIVLTLKNFRRRR